MIRAAHEGDIQAITAIYAFHVRHGLGSFELEPPDAVEMARRYAEVVDRDLPYLVAEREGHIVGFAYANRYHRRPAYRCTLEDSIYIHPEHTGQGIGRVLLPALIDACEQAGYRQLIAVIGDSHNLTSIRLHTGCGFQQVGLLRSVGFKLGHWLDTVFMQRPLGKGDTALPNPL